MAIYHLSTKPLSRSAGRSSVAAAAYRAAVKLRDERTAQVHDYERRSGVESAALLLPDGSAATAVDRAVLWNAAEAAEKRKDARTAREWVVAIPAELVPRSAKAVRLVGDPARDLVHEFAGELARRYGVAVDVAIHRPGRKGDDRNWHAHLLATTRQVTREAVTARLVVGDKAVLELSDAKRKTLGLGRAAGEVAAVRELWAGLANCALEREGHAQRIDHRTLAAQGIDRPATVHLGPGAAAMERRREVSDRGDHNRVVAAVVDLQAEHGRLEQERQEEKQRADERERQRRADPAVRLDEGRKLEERWTTAVGQEFKTIQARAMKLEKRGTAMLDRTRERLEKHRAAEPAKPGAVAVVVPGSRSRWEAAWKAWDRVRAAISKRVEQLRRRVELVREYRREPVAGYPTKGTLLATRKVNERQPKLAAQVVTFRNWRVQHERQQREAVREREAPRRGRGRSGLGPDIDL